MFVDIKEFQQNVYPSFFSWWKDKPEFAERLFKLFDLNNDNYLDFSEFVKGYMFVRKVGVEGRLKFVFNLVNPSGYSLNAEQLSSVLDCVVKTFPGYSKDLIPLMGSFIQMVFDKADLQGTGLVTYDLIKVVLIDQPLLQEFFHLEEPNTVPVVNYATNI